MKKLFIDMDGTLAEWQEGTPFEIVCERGYAAKLPINGNMVKATELLVDFCKKRQIEVYILSSVLDLPHSIPDKNAWLDKVLPGSFDAEHRLYVPYGEKKSDFVLRHFGFKKQSVAFSNCFLLDDYTENLAAWVNDGGTPIKVFNGINGKNGTYRGAYTCSWLNAEQITSDVLRAMKVRADDWVIDKIESFLQEMTADDGDDIPEDYWDESYIEGYVASINDIIRILGGDKL